MILGSGQVEKGGEGVRPPIVRSIIVTAIIDRTETGGKSGQVAYSRVQRLKFKWHFNLDWTTISCWTKAGLHGGVVDDFWKFVYRLRQGFRVVG